MFKFQAFVTGTAVTENPPGALFRIYGFGNANGGVLMRKW